MDSSAFGTPAAEEIAAAEPTTADPWPRRSAANRTELDPVSFLKRRPESRSRNFRNCARIGAAMSGSGALGGYFGGQLVRRSRRHIFGPRTRRGRACTIGPCRHNA